MKSIVISLMQLAFIFPGAFAQKLSSEQFEEEASEYIVKAIDQNAQNTVWPNFIISTIPSLFSFDNGKHLYIYPVIETVLPWQIKSIAQKNVLYYDNLEAYSVISVPIYPYSLDEKNQKIYAFDLTSLSKPLLSAFVFIHERFHIFQYSDIGFKYKQLPDYSHLRNEENTVDAYYENSKLFKFLSYLKDNYDHITADDIYKNDDLKLFLAFDYHRRKNFRNDPASKEDEKFEDRKEIMEGTANYVAAFSLPVSDANKLSIPIEEKICSIGEPIECLGKQIYYGFGFGAELVLHKLEIQGWQEKVSEQFISPVTILTQLWIEKGILSEKLISDLVAQEKQTASYLEIENKIEESMQKYSQEVDATLNSFNQLQPDVVRIQILQKNCSGGMRNEGRIYLTALNFFMKNVEGENRCSPLAENRAQAEMKNHFNRVPFVLTQETPQGSMFSFNILSTQTTLNLGDGKGEQKLSDLLPTASQKSRSFSYKNLQFNAENGLFSANYLNISGVLNIHIDKQSGIVIVDLQSIYHL